jgi:hypothetical protein
MNRVRAARRRGVLSYCARFGDASTLRVDTSLGRTPPLQHHTGAGACQRIGYAVGDRAALDDSIVAAAGTYHEHVTIDVSGLTLCSGRCRRSHTHCSERDRSPQCNDSFDTGIGVNVDNAAVDGFTTRHFSDTTHQVATTRNWQGCNAGPNQPGCSSCNVDASCADVDAHAACRASARVARGALRGRACEQEHLACRRGVAAAF